MRVLIILENFFWNFKRNLLNFLNFIWIFIKCHSEPFAKRRRIHEFRENTLNLWIFRYAQNDKDFCEFFNFSKKFNIFQKIHGIYKEIQRKFKEFKNFSKKFKKFSLRIEKRQIVSQGSVRIYLFLKMSWVLGKFG